MHERQELPGVQRFARRFQLGPQRVGERQIHVVAAKQNVFADADPLQLQDALGICNSDQAEIGGAATDVADQDDIAGSDQVAPCSARLRRPGVECRLWLLQQCDVPQARGLGGLGGEASCDLIERGRNGQDDLGLGEFPIPSLHTLGM
jgi:hypothetical protein